MTDQEINETIAEACGWTWGTDVQVAGRCWHDPTNKWRKLPSYTTDLNAMHEAEKATPVAYADAYSEWLDILTKKTMTVKWCATARQRAEAFLKTIGKWRGQ